MTAVITNDDCDTEVQYLGGSLHTFDRLTWKIRRFFIRMNMISIGTRKSKLALAYTEKAQKHLGFDTEQILIDSTADLNPKTPIQEMGGKGVFTKEIEKALIEKHIDIACHAMKDMTRDNDDLLEISCVLPRADFRDCLIGNAVDPKTIGTSSPRRMYQLMDLYPKAEIIPIRGNIDTRIAKQESGEYDAIVLAKAGLDTLGLTMKASRIFQTAEMIPAPNQGVIALQTRKTMNSKERNIYSLLWPKNNLDTWYCAMAEKAMLKEIDGDCHTPIGVLSYIDNDTIHMIAKNFETGRLGLEHGPSAKYDTVGGELGTFIK